MVCSAPEMTTVSKPKRNPARAEVMDQKKMRDLMNCLTPTWARSMPCGRDRPNSGPIAAFRACTQERDKVWLSAGGRKQKAMFTPAVGREDLDRRAIHEHPQRQAAIDQFDRGRPDPGRKAACLDVEANRRAADRQPDFPGRARFGRQVDVEQFAANCLQRIVARLQRAAESELLARVQRSDLLDRQGAKPNAFGERAQRQARPAATSAG